ncbi:3-dehydroquinate synthase [Tissierella creatinini]|nr:3-dehydroquinate synthase [Tissierella creatinini]TJX63782.1 3-dehydroquinate synthase [Soehngenia saccharolytica]
MEVIPIDLDENSYDIIIGENLINNLDDILSIKDERNFILTDRNVDMIYGDKLHNLKHFFKLTIEPGEKSKSIDVAIDVLRQMLEKGLTRKSTVIAFGGGVVGDLAGFCSSIYMRGISFIQIPTTLLAQVDSSVGGKTGVNLNDYKNIIGSFYQPKKVIIDVELLSTLPKKELMSGIGEIIKYGLIYDYEFFQYIKKEIEGIRSLNNNVMKYVVRRCCEIKARIVELDEKENGLRKILNFGHTFGHALEGGTNFTRYSHGEAVIVGMFYETILAKKMCVIQELYSNEILSFLESLGVDLSLSEYSTSVLIDFMTRDKKNKDNKISFILPINRGEVKEYLLDINEINWN